MTALTPALDAELRKDSPTVFGAVKIMLPDGTIRLIDGSGVLRFGGETYVGEDPTYGVISDVENLTDGVGDSAPAIGLTLLPAGDAAAAALAAPSMQGAPVDIYVGAVNPATGGVIPDPHLIFAGEVDVPTLDAGEQGRTVEYEVTSVFERLFEDDESARLSAGHHRSIFPNEAGMDFVTGVAETVYWGVPGVQGAVQTFSGGGAGYGGGGGRMVEQ
ncbi:hypothetical protein [Sphingomonas sp. GM_Shp_1]|uniref:hypothetical protein n=1 Tax=Sphingomonas sp. GM_Shp_1 TaxID=2937381 RepID=UPI00226B4E1C|nr:hypothetical protein [Sphingomonas sp. GM_Shp_1]